MLFCYQVRIILFSLSIFFSLPTMSRKGSRIIPSMCKKNTFVSLDGEALSLPLKKNKTMKIIKNDDCKQVCVNFLLFKFSILTQKDHKIKKKLTRVNK